MAVPTVPSGFHRQVCCRHCLLLFLILSLPFSTAIAQSVLLACMSLPYHHVLMTPRSAHPPSSLPYGLAPTDLLLTGLTLLDLYTQYMADNQQYSFQSYKHAPESSRQSLSRYTQGPFDITWTPEDAKRGFITRGLWAWSRHPNFACEQTFWALQGLFPLLSVGGRLSVRDKQAMILPHPLIPAIAVSLRRYSINSGYRG
jgi:steroid 5-alpha reductase family enzyme